MVKIDLPLDDIWLEAPIGHIMDAIYVMCSGTGCA
jgi:hypothetical protein